MRFVPLVCPHASSLLRVRQFLLLVRNGVLMASLAVQSLELSYRGHLSLLDLSILIFQVFATTSTLQT
jgi:hypothetical protein